MTVLEKLQKRTGETDTDLLEVLLDDAKNAILSRRFPFGDWPTIIEEQTVIDEETGEETTVEVDTGETYVEDRYLDLQYRIALELYNRQGAEGEVIHKENGIDRSYEGPWVSTQLLQEVTPYAGVISS